MIKSNHCWGKSNNAKLRELINQGKIDPKDGSLAAVKAIHKHWKHKHFKNFAELIRKKLKKVGGGQHIDSAQCEGFVCCESQFVDHNLPFLSAQNLAREEDSSDENSQEASEENDKEDERESKEDTVSSEEEEPRRRNHVHQDIHEEISQESPTTTKKASASKTTKAKEKVTINDDYDDIDVTNMLGDMALDKKSPNFCLKIKDP